VLLFLVKGVLLFVLWKSLYLFALKPGRVVDRPLTHSLSVATAVVLNFFNPVHPYSAADAVENIPGEDATTSYEVAKIYRNYPAQPGKEEVLSIGDACNALEVMILYVGFIICFPAPLSRKLAYIPAGLVLICLLNILRCAALAGIAIHFKSYFDLAHHFAFTFVVYALIFFLWYRFSKIPVSHGRSV
jgi:exosortase/archaeosortase family protein